MKIASKAVVLVAALSSMVSTVTRAGWDDRDVPFYGQNPNSWASSNWDRSWWRSPNPRDIALSDFFGRGVCGPLDPTVKDFCRVGRSNAADLAEIQVNWYAMVNGYLAAYH